MGHNELPNNRVFSDDVIRNLSKVYGDETDGVLSALRRPVRRYCIRVNTLKADPEVIVEGFRSRGIQAQSHDAIVEAILLPVRGPFPISLRERVVVVDKFTAESVLLGAQVYAPA